MKNENESFNYTYSAPQCEEIKKIRMKYEAGEDSEDKLEKLRRLDKSATNKATTVSVSVGIIGALLLGIGMSLIMTDFYEIFKLAYTVAVAIGTGVGLCGIVLVCLAYPLYNKCLKAARKKLAPEILKLTDELME